MADQRRAIVRSCQKAGLREGDKQIRYYEFHSVCCRTLDAQTWGAKRVLRYGLPSKTLIVHQAIP